LNTVKIGTLDISQFLLGSNPISGFSHLSREIDARMRHYFTTAQVKRLFRDAEALGVTTLLARADHHVMRLLMEYWDEGGSLKWIAQTCPEVGTIERGVQNAISGGASACFIHGGLVDHLFGEGKLDEIPPALEQIRAAGLPAGIAGHNPDVHRWAEQTLDLDFYMCCYYNPSSRAASPEHQAGAQECFVDEDRQVMTGLIQTLSRPVIHYKVMAAGRNNPDEAFAFVRSKLRPSDAVCVGVYDQDDPDMLKNNIQALCG